MDGNEWGPSRDECHDSAREGYTCSRTRRDGSRPEPRLLVRPRRVRGSLRSPRGGLRLSRARRGRRDARRISSREPLLAHATVRAAARQRHEPADRGRGRGADPRQAGRGRLAALPCRSRMPGTDGAPRRSGSANAWSPTRTAMCCGLPSRSAYAPSRPGGADASRRPKSAAAVSCPTATMERRIALVLVKRSNRASPSP